MLPQLTIRITGNKLWYTLLNVLSLWINSKHAYNYILNMPIHRPILLLLLLSVFFASDATAQAVPTLLIDDVEVNEDVGSVIIPITLFGDNVPGGFTITLTSRDDETTAGSDYTAINTDLTFTGTVGETIMVTVFIIDDPNPIAEGPESFTLNMTISGTTETVDIPDEATVTILDNDTLIMAIEDNNGNTGNISVNENVGDAQACIKFSIGYDEEFEIQVASFTLTATPDVDYQRINRTLTATTTEQADTGRCFPFAIVNDIHVEDDETFSVAIFLSRVPSFNFEFSDTTLIYTIIDNDNATLSIDQITVEENAGHANVMVTADRRIENTFTVGVSTLDGTAVMGLDYGALTNEPLIFPKLNTGSGATRTIMVPIVDDLIMESTETFLVSLTHLEDTPISRRIALPNPITVTVFDNDVTTIGIILDPAILTVDEGANSTYTVALNIQPTSEVTVTIGSDGDVSATPTALTFTTTDWNTPQLVTVSATQDDDAFNDTATLAHNAQGGGYDSVTANLDVTVNDDDTAEIILDLAMLTVDEGNTNTYNVSLNTLPITDITVTISSDGDVSASPAVLTFTMIDWNIQQTVTVTATQEDDNALNDNATLSHNASGGGYNSVLKNLAVTIIDDDTADFILIPLC